MKSGVFITAITSIVMIGSGYVERVEARPSTKALSCSAVKQLVNQRGGVVLDTKNSRVYKRFVKNRTFCNLEQVTRNISVPSKSGSCRLKICVEITPGGGSR